jgi:hypothetical protein
MDALNTKSILYEEGVNIDVSRMVYSFRLHLCADDPATEIILCLDRDELRC